MNLSDRLQPYLKINFILKALIIFFLAAGLLDFIASRYALPLAQSQLVFRVALIDKLCVEDNSCAVISGSAQRGCPAMGINRTHLDGYLNIYSQLYPPVPNDFEDIPCAFRVPKSACKLFVCVAK
jgi:hypothetical protein